MGLHGHHADDHPGGQQVFLTYVKLDELMAVNHQRRRDEEDRPESISIAPQIGALKSSVIAGCVHRRQRRLQRASHDDRKSLNLRNHHHAESEAGYVHCRTEVNEDQRLDGRPGETGELRDCVPGAKRR